jgi:virginiamycin B lyase
MHGRFVLVFAVLILTSGCGLNSLALHRPNAQSAEPQVFQSGQPPINWAEFPSQQSTSMYEMTAGSDGAMWFMSNILQGSQYEIAIARIDMNGNMAFYPLIAGDNGELPPIIAGDPGVLWTSLGSTIYKITTDGTITQIPLTPPTSAGVGLARGQLGVLWFADQSNNNIDKLRPDGTIVSYHVPTPNAGLEGMTTGPDGAVWFCETNRGIVGRILPRGAITEFTVGGTPVRIITGADKNLWFTDPATHSIGKMTTTGIVTHYPIKPNYPIFSIALGSDGKIWFIRGNSSSASLGSITPQGVIHYHQIPGPVETNNAPGIAGGPDGNIWFTHLTTVGVYIEKVLAVSPSSITFTGPGQTVAISITENKYQGVWTAVSSNTSVATVAPGSGPTNFNVTSVGSGACVVTVSDAVGNSFNVNVTVP